MCVCVCVCVCDNRPLIQALLHYSQGETTRLLSARETTPHVLGQHGQSHYCSTEEMTEELHIPAAKTTLECFSVTAALQNEPVVLRLSSFKSHDRTRGPLGWIHPCLRNETTVTGWEGPKGKSWVDMHVDIMLVIIYIVRKGIMSQRENLRC